MALTLFFVGDSMENLIVQTGTRYAARRLARIALQNFLYVPGWQLEEYLKKIWLGQIYARISLALHDGTPIGCAVEVAVADYRAFTPKRKEPRDVFFVCQVFVREQHRRKGVGTALILALSKSAKRVDPGSEDGLFWEALKRRELDLEVDYTDYTVEYGIRDTRLGNHLGLTDCE